MAVSPSCQAWVCGYGSGPGVAAALIGSPRTAGGPLMVCSSWRPGHGVSVTSSISQWLLVLKISALDARDGRERRTRETEIDQDQHLVPGSPHST